MSCIVSSLMGRSLQRERVVLLGIWALAALGCLLGFRDIPEGLHGERPEQLLDLLRLLSTAALALTLLLGPGLLWRAAAWRPPTLGFLFLPGLALLAAAGGLAWALAGSVDPRVTCFAICAPLLGLILGGLLAAGPEDLLSGEEQWALLVVGCAFGLAVGRALWSLGPSGELFGGSVARTLEVGDRADARLPFAGVALVANGSPPFGAAATEYFAPYDFSSRGPIPPLAAAPVVLLSGGHPPLNLPTEYVWNPFDNQGYMAYRLAMMAFACTAFLALWDLVRRLGGTLAARLAVLLAATTPFLIHEIWFTWPKLLAATFVLLSAVCIVERKAVRSGLLAGAGYLMHPGALVSLSAIGLLALWPLKGARLRRPQIRAALLLVGGVAVSLVAWRLLTGDNYTQSGFTDYFQWASVENLHPSPGEWLTYRAESVLNTLVPFVLPLFFADNVSINVFGGTSPPVIHFFFQYWDGVPFGFAIVFFPLLLVSLWRAWRLWRWPVTATVIVPFVFFAIYWGASNSGMLREGAQQAWALTILAVIALQQRQAGFPWLRSTPIRALLSLRVVEVLALILVPTLATNGLLILNSVFGLTDAVALLATLGFSAGLAALVWNQRPKPPVGERRLGVAAPGQPAEAAERGARD